MCEDLITVDDEKNIIDLTFTPTIPHCSMATLIGLTIRVKLIRSLPSRFKVSVKITEGSHSQVNTLNVKSDAFEKDIKSGLGIHLLRGGRIFDPVREKGDQVTHMYAVSLLIHPNFSSKLIIM